MRPGGTVNCEEIMLKETGQAFDEAAIGRELLTAIKG
jgi:hypothetical protein